MSDQIITIESLQVGQQVVIAHKYGPHTVETVTRITKTQIITDSDMRFSKKSGDAVGEHASNVFTYHWLARQTGCSFQLMTVDQLNEINCAAEQEQERKAIIRLIKAGVNDGKLQHLSAADLQTIASLMGLE